MRNLGPRREEMRNLGLRREDEEPGAEAGELSGPLEPSANVTA
jgi:hypothetical protein